MSQTGGIAEFHALISATPSALEHAGLVQGTGSPRAARFGMTPAWLRADVEALNQQLIVAAPVKTLAGKSIDPLKGAKPVVMFFTTNDCPVANKMVPEILRITNDYKGKVRFLMVYTDPQSTLQELKTHQEDYQLKSIPGTHDHNHILVRAADAKITPEAAILINGKAVYRGRINNYYEDFGKPRSVITQHDLRIAIDAVLAGKPAPAPRGESIGCYITKLK